MVDTPYLFGQVAATNALSDVYAMGGVPLTAMNLVAFPIAKLDPGILREILKGGLDKIREAGAVLAGGHSLDDPEIKYGLAVTGEVHPDRFWSNHGALAGDVILLTKPLGNGILATALKAGFIDEQEMAPALEWMVQLNQLPPDEENRQGSWRDQVHACTDVTGFGLSGHLYEMIAAGEVGAFIETHRVPLLERAEELVSLGMFPGGGHRNRDHFGRCLLGEDLADPLLRDLLFDPQTSGGLLLAVSPDEIDSVVLAFNRGGRGCWPIGHFTDRDPGRIMLV